MDLFYFVIHIFFQTKYVKVDFLSDKACTPRSKLQIMKAIDTAINFKRKEVLKLHLSMVIINSTYKH